MTQLEAEQKRDRLNTLLENANVDFEYVVIESYCNYVQSFDVVKIPSIFLDAYENATFVQQQAFARISLAASFSNNFSDNFKEMIEDEELLSEYVS